MERSGGIVAEVHGPERAHAAGGHLLADFVEVLELQLSPSCQSDDADTDLINEPKLLHGRDAEQAQDVRACQDSCDEEASDAWHAQLRRGATKNSTCWS